MGARLTVRAVLFVVACTIGGAAAAQDCVVVLHGLGRSSWSMALLAHRLGQAGFAVVTPDYPSREAPIAQLAAVVGDGIDTCRRDGHAPVHFVTHSLGGILVRAWFQRGVPADLGRIVMLAPPNAGSEIADHARDAGWYRWSTGMAGQQLGTEPTSLPNQLAPLPLEVGVIAGTVSLEPWFAAWLPGPNDGKVTVARARLAGMRDFLTVPHGHTFIMNGRDVAAQTIAFLRAGRFAR